MCVCFVLFVDDSNSYTEDVQNKFTAVRNEEVLLPKESSWSCEYLDVWAKDTKSDQVINQSQPLGLVISI